MITLSPREWQVLQVLVAHADRTVSMAQLIDRVWRASSRRTVISTVHRLRQKLEDDPSHPRYIHTTPGIAYRFSAPVRFLDGLALERESIRVGHGAG